MSAPADTVRRASVRGGGSGSRGQENLAHCLGAHICDIGEAGSGLHSKAAASAQKPSMSGRMCALRPIHGVADQILYPELT